MRYLWVMLGVFALGVVMPLTAQQEKPDKKILEKLKQKVSLHFNETPLKDAFQMVGELTGVKIVFDEKSEKICKESTITVRVQDIPLKDALSVMVTASPELKWKIKGGAILITTEEEEPAKSDISVADCINEFGVALYKTLIAGENGNILFSPLSIEYALGMVYAGARGSTKEQMRKALCFTLADEKLHQGFAELKKGVVTQKEGLSFFMANALWGQKDYPFKKGFISLMQKHYDAGLRFADFKKEPATARKSINDWVAKETQDKIKELLPEGAVHRLTRLVLTNALFFKGLWKYKFKKENTKKMEFHISADKTVTVEMMQMRAEGKKWEGIRYFKGQTVRILELPYKGEQFSFVIFLPRKVDGLAELERGLTIKKLNGWLSKLKQLGEWDLTNIYIPKFELTWGTRSLKGHLQAMGMKEAFKETADLMGISDVKPLFVEDVFHKAYVRVDEEGTEAAAATAVEEVWGSIPDFKADHPFLFMIYHRKSGAILFIGRLVDPTAK